MRQRRSGRHTTRNLILAGIVCGAVPWATLVVCRDAILQSGSDAAEVFGATLAYGGLHAPWLSNVSFNWPLGATDLGALFVNVVYYPLLFLLIAGIRSSIRKPTPDDAPACIECGYNLTGNLSGRCPECGEPADHGTIGRPIRRNDADDFVG